MNDQYHTYPNMIGARRGEAEARGCVRSGMIETNAHTTEKGIAGKFAAVTHEEIGVARVYVFEPAVGGVPLWKGPETVLSEEVIGAML